ncbi:putative phosphohydrolase [Mycobacterium tuberculosis]|nr:putative phosphohydrolase [Mycobacterium tuberculosis]
MGGNTSIKATHYAVTGSFGAMTTVEEFTLTRPRGGSSEPGTRDTMRFEK